MFPTIFALSIENLGEKTKQASSFLIMAIVGGAIAPVLMGYIGEKQMSVGYIVPLICFVVILAFGMHKNKHKQLTS
jgi:FHS family L-fucose permease-like MFS transporter